MSKILIDEVTAKQVLEYVESVPDDRYAVEHLDRDTLVTDLREALNAPLAEQKSGIKQVIELYDSPVKPAPVAKPHEQEPVGEIGKIVMFGGDLKEVSWKNGKMPPVGSVLYTSPPAAQQQEPVAKMGMYEHKCPNVTGHRGPSFVCQKAWHGVGQNSYCKGCTCPEALNTTPPAQRKPMTYEMVKQMKENCTSMEMRGAFADGWLSAEAAHGIKENT